MNITKEELGRIRSLQRANRFKRGGHGKKHKFKPIDQIRQRYEERRKKIMEKWIADVARWFVKEKAGIVQIESLEGLKSKIRKNQDFFSIHLRKTWPIAEMINRLKNKFNEFGIEVKEVNPYFSSQICSNPKCHHWNQHFDFEYRKDKGFPLFRCEKCVAEDNLGWSADYNAAKNLTNLDWDKIVKRSVPAEDRKHYESA
jgi:IS605 OrfB family transposase